MVRAALASFLGVLVLSATTLLAANTYSRVDLVSDTGAALITDSNLVNAWGVAVSPSGGAFWVSNNGTSTSTLYSGDVAGSPFQKNSLVVTVTGDPTGVVFNGTSSFIVSGAAARFIYVTEDGTMRAWSPPLGSGTALVATKGGAIYKGIAEGNNGSGDFLYAADFHDGTIDVYNSSFAPVTLAGSFTDPTLPTGYAPFNIANLGGKLYVSYAVQDSNAEDEVAGPGNGLVDVYDLNGTFLQRLISNGALNAPWAMVLAPAGFANFPSALLVGNFGDGTINAYNATTGAFLGTIMNTSGSAMVIDGLWGLTFGNGVTAGDANTLYFAAGPNDEANGLFGKLVVAAAANTLSGTAANVSFTEGQSATVTVATFTDANGPSIYSATIGWGDSSSSAGTIISNGDGSYDVQGTHGYAEESASTPITVTITDLNDSGTVTLTGSATIADAPLTASGMTVNSATLLYNGPIATFTDANPLGSVSDFSATIDWGDGVTTAGTITSNAGTFTVSGAHNYTLAGAYTVTVTINDIGGQTATATSLALVGGAIPVFGWKTLMALFAVLAVVAMKGVARLEG